VGSAALEPDARRHPSGLASLAAMGDVCVVAFEVLGDQERAWREAVVAMAQTNYVGTVSVGVPVGQRMLAQGHRSVVAVSTVATERHRRANFLYGSTKAGVDAFYTGFTEARRPAGCMCRRCAPGSCTVG